MTTQHTPGPWFTDESADRPHTELTIFASDKSGDPWTICRPIDPLDDFDVRCANARLIAAAPELLSALEDTLRLIELLNAPGTGDPIEAAVYAAKQAIAKAKGAA